MKDFHLQYIESVQNPLLLWIKKDIQKPNSILIKIKGDPIKAYDDIKSIYQKVYNQELTDENPFYDQKIMLNYDRQIRLSKMMSLFAFIAIVISMLGIIAMSTYYIQQRNQEIAVRKVFGSSNKEILMKLIRTFMIYVILAFIIAMSTYYIQQRDQEIAVRKVFGSSNKEILIKLIRTFMVYVLIAFVIAIPIIYYFMSNWLSEYNYRISLSWWIYAISGIFCLMISFCAVFIQSYKAANSNPVDSIKNN